MSQELAKQYDAVPYPGLPVVRSQPDFLASVARLRGLQSATVNQARVLELGCAGGQNLLPLADRYPGARLVGIDLSGNQISAARQVVDDLGMTNVEFRQQDILELDASLGTFDYIIAHGIYSWVEEPVRDKLLSLCRELLAPQGVAYVSYKTYPGWHLHDMVRDMMRFDSRNAQTPSEKIQRARMFLDFLANCFTTEGAYDQLIRAEAEPLAKQSDAYLWHDHLAPISHPVFFRQFMAEANGHGLQHLGEATLGVKAHDLLDGELEKQLAAITNDPIEQEQFRDRIRNRGVRQALLCHANAAVRPSVETSEPLLGMYLSGALRPEVIPVQLSSPEVAHFALPNGARVGTHLPLAKAALLHLGEIWPAAIKTEDLLTAVCDRVVAAGAQGPIPPESLQRLRDNLYHCCIGQVIQVHSDADSFVTLVSQRPTASPLVRYQAARSAIVANRRHEPVRLDSFDVNLVRMLDGTQTTDELLERLTQAAATGEIVVLDRQQRQQSGDNARRALAESVPPALQRLARAAVLIA